MMHSILCTKELEELLLAWLCNLHNIMHDIMHFIIFDIMHDMMHNIMHGIKNDIIHDIIIYNDIRYDILCMISHYC